MTYKTTAPGGGMPRVVEGPKPRYKTAAQGGCKVTECDRRGEYQERLKQRYGPWSFRPWPFDPSEPKPRPQTWRNRFRIARRWALDRASLVATAAVAYWIGTLIGKVL